MSSRSRQSRVGATPGRQSHAATPFQSQQNALPTYKKPSHPLDGEAQRALRELNGTTLTSVKKYNKEAIITIRSTAEGVNDMLSEHQRFFDARSKKWEAGKKLDEKEDEEAIMDDLQQKVDDATAKLEESLRTVIDSSIAAQRIEDALEWLRQNAPRQIEEEYESQITRRATQRRHTQNRAGGEADEEQEDLEESPTPGPTPLDRSQLALTGSAEMFSDRMTREQDRYTSLSLTARYARHNEYRDFKRVVHDARHGDTIPLGHEDTWFTEAGAPALGVTQVVNEDEDDIVIDREKVSTKCPITFQTLKEPYTSTKCGGRGGGQHTFEKSAILDMIRTSGSQFGTGGKKSVACPISGCDNVRLDALSILHLYEGQANTISQQLTADDLRSDPVLIRKIRRLQQVALEESQMDLDEDDDDDDNDDLQNSQPQNTHASRSAFRP